MNENASVCLWSNVRYGYFYNQRVTGNNNYNVNHKQLALSSLLKTTKTTNYSKQTDMNKLHVIAHSAKITVFGMFFFSLSAIIYTNLSHLKMPSQYQRNFTLELFFSDDKNVFPDSNLLYSSALNAIWSNDCPPNLLRRVSLSLWDEAATWRDWKNNKGCCQRVQIFSYKYCSLHLWVIWIFSYLILLNYMLTFAYHSCFTGICYSIFNVAPLKQFLHYTTVIWASDRDIFYRCGWLFSTKIAAY